MANRISKVQERRSFEKLDILSNLFYGKLLLLVAAGFDTYPKLQQFRELEEERKIHYANLNVQVGRLLAHGYLIKVGMAQHQNKVRFQVDWALLGDLFFKHCLDKISSYEQVRRPLDRSKAKKANLMDILKANPGISLSDAKESAEWGLTMVEKTSKEFQLSKKSETLMTEKRESIIPFLIDCLKEYIRTCPTYILINTTLSEHFELIEEEIMTKFHHNELQKNFKARLDRQSHDIAFFLVQLSWAKRPTAEYLTSIFNRHFTFTQQETEAVK